MNSSDLGEAVRLDAAARAHEKPVDDLEKRVSQLLEIIVNMNERIKLLTDHADLTNRQLDALEAALNAAKH